MLTLCIISAAQAQTLELVKEINTTSTSNSFPFDFNVVNNTLFFLAQGNSGTYGLWITTGTAASTEMISPATGPLNNIPDIIPYKNKVYFQYNTTGNDYELWQSDGTVGGTTLFDDIYPGSTGSYPTGFTVANSKLFFMANDATGNNNLYVSDGTVAGTIRLKAGISLFNGNADFAVLNNDIYFTSDNGSGMGYGLWKSDGTVAGTVLVDGSIGATGGKTVLNNKLYFSADDGIHGSELWVTDGTLSGTNLVKNLLADMPSEDIYGNGSPFAMTVYNNKLYFTATGDSVGAELFVSDGTSAGTHIVKDIYPGNTGSDPSFKVVYNGFLYFTAGGVDSAGLYRTDGTAAGTISVKPGIFNGKFPAINDGLLYIIANNDDQLFQSDGTMAGTLPIQLTNTSNPVSSLSADSRFQLYNGFVYLCAENNDLTVGYELCRISATLLPLHLVSFTGKTDGSNDILNWVTANEVNTASFTIEKSADGRLFTIAGKVQSAAAKALTTSYNYTYPSVNNPSGFYRLQMVDKDGKFTYSNIIQLKRDIKHNITAAYNTANKLVTITNSSNAACNWQLISMNGALVKQGNSTDALITINTSGFAAGTYIISCKALNETVSTRMIIY